MGEADQRRCQCQKRAIGLHVHSSFSPGYARLAQKSICIASFAVRGVITPRTACHVGPYDVLTVVTVFALSAFPISNRGRMDVWPKRKLRLTASPSRLKRASRYNELVVTSATPSE